jgi:hypothetical protein
MTRIGDLIRHPDYRMRMIAVRRAWAHSFLREGNRELSAANFEAARSRLREVRESINENY